MCLKYQIGTVPKGKCTIIYKISISRQKRNEDIDISEPPGAGAITIAPCSFSI